MPGLILLFLLGLLLAISLTVWLTIRRLRRPPRRTAAWAVSRNLPTSPAELNPPRPYDSFNLRLDPRSSDESPIWSIPGDLANSSPPNSPAPNSPRGPNPLAHDSPRASNSPTIIITPGWGDSRITMLARIQHLLPHARRIIVWDPPAHGDAPRGGLSSLGAREPELLINLIHWAYDNDPTSPIILYGFSLGAGASIVAAASPRATGFACSDAMPVSPPSDPASRTAQDAPLNPPPSPPLLLAVIAEAPYRFPWTPARNVLHAIGLPHRIILPITFLLLGLRLGVGPTWRRAHNHRGFDRAAHAAHLTIPLLILHAENDEVCPITDSEHIAHAAPQHATLIRIPTPAAAPAHLELWNPPTPELLAAVTSFLNNLTLHS